MNTIKWYAHGSYSTASGNLEELNRVGVFASEEAKKKLANELRNFFYEVEFDVEFNELTGKISKVTMVEK